MQSSNQIDAIMLSEKDNVATALRELAEGEQARVGVGERCFAVPVGQAIAFGHKLAVHEIPRGTDVLKYGEVIGRATHDIPAGMHAHVHNIESLRGRGDLQAAGESHGL
jgi:altronate dehydratase small subunit